MGKVTVLLATEKQFKKYIMTHVLDTEWYLTTQLARRLNIFWAIAMHVCFHDELPLLDNPDRFDLEDFFSDPGWEDPEIAKFLLESKPGDTCAGK